MKNLERNGKESPEEDGEIRCEQGIRREKHELWPKVLVRLKACGGSFTI